MFQDGGSRKASKVMSELLLEIISKYIKISFMGKFGVWGRRCLEWVDKWTGAIFPLWFKIFSWE